MSITITSPQYPFDPSGTKITNRVVGELQPLTGAGDRDYYTVVPLAAPFYAESFSCSVKNLQGEIVPLFEGKDYLLTHWFMGASKATAKPVYASITFLNHTLRGTLIISPYQCVGGDWIVDSNTIAKVLADQVSNPRTIAWEQVSGYPSIFPPVPHEWNKVDLIGQKEILAALNRITDAILTQISSAMSQHINDNSGHAHGITAVSIGAVTIDQLTAAVQNAVRNATATTDNIREGTTNKYFTEGRVMATRIAGYAVSNTVDTLSEQDTLLTALIKLQAQLVAARTELTKKASLNRPAFTGLGSQNLVRLEMRSTFAIDITQAEVFQVKVMGNGSIGFDISRLGDMSDKVIEFAVTTINDSSANQYALAWPSNVKWVEGTPPPRTTTPNAKDSWYFWSEDGGATWTGSLSNANTR